MTIRPIKKIEGAGVIYGNNSAPTRFVGAKEPFVHTISLTLAPRLPLEGGVER